MQSAVCSAAHGWFALHSNWRLLILLQQSAGWGKFRVKEGEGKPKPEDGRASHKGAVCLTVWNIYYQALLKVVYSCASQRGYEQ